MNYLKENTMKISILKSNLVLPLIVITLFLVSSCENNDEILAPINDSYLSIPDSNFETKLIELGIDSDGVVNHLILKSDAEAVTRLDLNISSYYGNINDLTGIEGFVNISFLSASGQKFNTIDLSKNTQLDTLYISGNILSHIDIGSNSKLMNLDIESNELSSISGLSNLSNLKKLNLSFNNFEHITIQNESVEVLLISHNLLKTLNTNEAPKLTNALLIVNQLTSVDFSSNTLLETLVISGNKLQNINLENNHSLTHFYASSNLFTNLDVSNNESLIDLRIDRNPELSCIKILSDQHIPTVSISDYQSLNTNCN
jgi:Leucine-rich repeat (LRR) protein